MTIPESPRQSHSQLQRLSRDLGPFPAAALGTRGPHGTPHSPPRHTLRAGFLTSLTPGFPQQSPRYPSSIKQIIYGAGTETARAGASEEGPQPHGFYPVTVQTDQSLVSSSPVLGSCSCATHLAVPLVPLMQRAGTLALGSHHPELHLQLVNRATCTKVIPQQKWQPQARNPHTNHSGKP